MTRLDTLASHDPNPEEALLEREEETSAPRPRKLPRAFQRALRELPETEAAVVFLCTKGVPKKRIATMLGVSRPAIQRRERRARKRLRWLLEIGCRFTSQDVRRQLPPVVGERDAEILASLWETTSEQRTAQALGVSLGIVHDTLSRGLAKMRGRKRLAKFRAGFETLGRGGSGALMRARIRRWNAPAIGESAEGPEGRERGGAAEGQDRETLNERAVASPWKR